MSKLLNGGVQRWHLEKVLYNSGKFRRHNIENVNVIDIKPNTNITDFFMMQPLRLRLA